MRILLLSVSMLVMACGGDAGDSGVDRDKQIGELSEGEARDVCSASIEAQGGEGSSTDCGDGVTYEVGTIDECVADFQTYASCDLTVGQIEDCIADWEDPCENPPASCQPLFECALGGS